MATTLATQPSFPSLCPVTEAVKRIAEVGGVEERGAVFTRSEVVQFILDLTGYTENSDLVDCRLLEPSFGDGDFLLPAIDRLLAVAGRLGKLSFDDLAPAICAVELHRATFEATKVRVQERLHRAGIAPSLASQLSDVWLHQGDFLLADIEGPFSHVVGNPPYVRQEAIPDILIAEYRQRYRTIYDRADIYVPFFERSLELLDDTGELGFICADRWMKNKYGKKLRAYVSSSYSLKYYIDMVDTDAFHDDVSAYPAITVINRSNEFKTRVYQRPEIEASALQSIARELTSRHLPAGSKAQEVERVADGSEPWILDDFKELALVRKLERQYPALEEVGCRVGIGVATGADRAFIDAYKDIDVEPSRKLPLVMTRDIKTGHVEWQGKGIINPFGDDGKLVDLDEYPKLKSFLLERREQIEGRHIAKKNPKSWYRTIDRIYPELAKREKLLIPDIKGDASIVYEGGSLYPHHNLYFVTSDNWDIRALQALLRSGIARLFVSLYCTRMRGGYLRFQAQYLRKIRLPRWSDVGPELRERLIQSSETNDRHALNEIVSELYGLTPDELALVEGRPNA